jgi:hypothetical protein
MSILLTQGVLTMNKSLMADIAESSLSESDIEDVDYDVKEASSSYTGWVDLEIRCEGALKNPTDI